MLIWIPKVGKKSFNISFFQLMCYVYVIKFPAYVSVCNFQSMRSPLELNSLFLTLFCYITWFDDTWHWKPCKGQKGSPFLKSVTHIYSDETWHTYTLTDTTFTLMQTFAAHMNPQKLTGVPRSSKFSSVHIYYDTKSCSLSETVICYCWKLWLKKSKNREKLKLKVREFGD